MGASFLDTTIEAARAGDATSRNALAHIEGMFLLGSDEQRTIAEALRPTPTNETDEQFVARVAGRR